MPTGIQQTNGSYNVITTTISTAATGLSSVVDLNGFSMFGLMVPSTWSAANITIQAADTAGGTFMDVYDDAGNEVSITAAASRAVGCDSNALKIAPFRYVKFRSGVTATPVVQSTICTLKIITKG